MSETPKDDLQFDKAEYAAPLPTPTCAACKSPIGATYWEANGHVVCAHCSEQIVAHDSVAQSQPPYALALGWGTLAAVAGAVGWALMLSFGIQLALVSIGIGWLVGKAIHHATKGRGGIPFQVMAVLLTYVSIVVGWIPTVLRAEGIDVNSRTIVAAFVPSLTLPFTGVGFLGILILGFGLWQAWRMNPQAKLVVTGPFQLATRRPSAEASQGG